MASLLLRASKNYSIRAVARGADVAASASSGFLSPRSSSSPSSSSRTVSTALVSSTRQAPGAPRRPTAPPLSLLANCDGFLGRQQRRHLETEAEFHPVADATLEAVQDAVDAVFDSPQAVAAAAAEYEVSLANGVLNLSLPPHGTWVLNKQTPNRQIWWSSPLSGPKRFEYDDKDKVWISTKDGLKLGFSLAEEIHHCYPDLDKLDLDV